MLLCTKEFKKMWHNLIQNKYGRCVTILLLFQKYVTFPRTQAPVLATALSGILSPTLAPVGASSMAAVMVMATTLTHVRSAVQLVWVRVVSAPHCRSVPQWPERHLHSQGNRCQRMRMLVSVMGDGGLGFYSGDDFIFKWGFGFFNVFSVYFKDD